MVQIESLPGPRKSGVYCLHPDDPHAEPPDPQPEEHGGEGHSGETPRKSSCFIPHSDWWKHIMQITLMFLRMHLSSAATVVKTVSL